MADDPIRPPPGTPSVSQAPWTTPLPDWRSLGALLIVGVVALTAVAGQFLEVGALGGSTDFHWWVVSTRNATLAVVAVLILALLIGTAVGAFAAFGPKFFSALLARLVELSGALPSLIVVGLWRIAEPNPNWQGFVLVVGLLKSIETARLISTETSRVSSQEFVAAARALGASRSHVFLQHVTPHLLPALVVSLALTAASVVGLEAALSFIGLGIPGSSSWGASLGELALSELRQPGSGATVRPWLALGSILATSWALYTLSRRLDQTN